MIRAQSLTNNEPVRDWRQERGSIWVDVMAPTEEELAELRSAFDFNPLALEDALTHGQWSRFEAYPEHVFLVFRTLDDPAACNDETERLSLFWYPRSDTLLTLSLRRVDYLERTWAQFEPLGRGSEEQIIHTLLARGADSFFSFADALQERIDALEEEMFTSADAQLFARQVFEYKHLILDVRRLVSNARESIAAFSRHAVIITNSTATANGHGDLHAQQLALYFRDVADTLSRVYESLDSAREVLSSVLDVNLSVQTHRLNEVMKILATVSTIFLPLTFMAGIWGMNFAFMPELEWRYGYLLAWLSFAVVGAALALYFRKRGWW